MEGKWRGNREKREGSKSKGEKTKEKKGPAKNSCHKLGEKRKEDPILYLGN
jgi:hypothetical protein